MATQAHTLPTPRTPSLCSIGQLQGPPLAHYSSAKVTQNSPQTGQQHTYASSLPITRTTMKFVP